MPTPTQLNATLELHQRRSTKTERLLFQGLYRLYIPKGGQINAQNERNVLARNIGCRTLFE